MDHQGNNNWGANNQLEFEEQFLHQEFLPPIDVGLLDQNAPNNPQEEAPQIPIPQNPPPQNPPQQNNPREPNGHQQNQNRILRNREEILGNQAKGTLNRLCARMVNYVETTVDPTSLLYSHNLMLIRAMRCMTLRVLEFNVDEFDTLPFRQRMTRTLLQELHQFCLPENDFPAVGYSEVYKLADEALESLHLPHNEETEIAHQDQHQILPRRRRQINQEEDVEERPLARRRRRDH